MPAKVVKIMATPTLQGVPMLSAVTPVMRAPMAYPMSRQNL
eukprot:CAMPEP_0184319516 /NCGR_PEP_ID=MMETSP1049-20130417/108987_1 /TAXON_ID=77928 /ORGANISM="Proteomonas sulcata, Strain CCMP704" /LENGTH=40 /DNA_ID= /DNA_START= /DNA_END= /DNA_ORIENTATION=